MFASPKGIWPTMRPLGRWLRSVDAWTDTINRYTESAEILEGVPWQVAPRRWVLGLTMALLRLRSLLARKRARAGPETTLVVWRPSTACPPGLLEGREYYWPRRLAPASDKTNHKKYVPGVPRLGPSPRDRDPRIIIVAARPDGDLARRPRWARPAGSLGPPLTITLLGAVARVLFLRRWR